MSFDHLFFREYDPDKYSCAHLVAEAWENETGKDIKELIAGFLLPAKERHGGAYLRRHFTPLDKPESPCLVVMHRNNTPPHTGIFIGGRILHIQPSGVQWMPPFVVTMGYDRVRYYRCNG